MALMRNRFFPVMLLISVTMGLALAATGCNTTRKCTGKRGVRVPMGIM